MGIEELIADEGPRLHLSYKVGIELVADEDAFNRWADQLADQLKRDRLRMLMAFGEPQ